MKFDCFFIITERVIGIAKVGICCDFCAFLSNFFTDNKRLLMKFDCFFVIIKTSITLPRLVYAVPSVPLSPIAFAILRDC